MSSRQQRAASWDHSRYAAAHFGHIAHRREREYAAEVDLVHRFFGRASTGFFVEVGANEPKRFSQTWALEQAGWRGVLIEPTPELCEALREHRPGSTVIEAACSAPARVGKATFHIASDLQHSALDNSQTDFTPDVARKVEVQVTTLDHVLDEMAAPAVDFVSIDVEGGQLDVLEGFDLARHRPRLLFIEDHLINLRTHRHIRAKGYRLVKRTGLNNWYVPADVPFAMADWQERFRLWRKLWLRTWARGLRAQLHRRFRR